MTNTALKSLTEALNSRVIGQPHVAETIAPYVNVYEAGLSPVNRPAGIFTLLGPTGVGKTKFVEALAEVLHGNRKNVIRVDCGEYQMDHEIAKLIGSPPGYLGHQQTVPVLSQEAINNVASKTSSLSLVLLDEIEKACNAMAQLMLGVFDKASLKLGDNKVVDFSRTMIFMTSNVGSKEVVKEAQRFGLARATPSTGFDSTKISKLAMSRVYSPEFINRIDEQITFRSLTEEDLYKVLDLELAEIRLLISQRLGDSKFFINPDRKAKEFLISKGFSTVFGARELKRMVTRYVLQPLAQLVVSGKIAPGAIVNITVGDDALKFSTKKLKLVAA